MPSSINKQLSTPDVLRGHVRRIRNDEQNTGGPWVGIGSGFGIPVIPMENGFFGITQSFAGSTSVQDVLIDPPPPGVHRKSGQVRCRGFVACKYMDLGFSPTNQDNFNRANGALGGSWFGDTTGFSIVSNQCQVAGGGEALVLLDSGFGATFGNVRVNFTVSQFPTGGTSDSSIGLIARMDSSFVAGYILVATTDGSDTLSFVKRTASGDTTMKTITITDGWQAGSVLQFIVFANTLYAYIDNVEVMQQLDDGSFDGAPLPHGFAGMYANASSTPPLGLIDLFVESGVGGVIVDTCVSDPPVVMWTMPPGYRIEYAQTFICPTYSGGGDGPLALVKADSDGKITLMGYLPS